MVLTLALSYGARSEIVEAARRIAREVEAGRLKPEDLDHDLFTRHLYTADMPDPDLLIRTSGEFRLSNFLLWQLAYTELYFTDTLWPDFREEELMKAIYEYQQRDRRFGLTQEQIKGAAGSNTRR
jgi:undecaprenyl diphosphate synthase